MGLYKLQGTVKYPAQATPGRSSLSRVPENGTHGWKGAAREAVLRHNLVMRFSIVFAALACIPAAVLRAADSPEVERARQEVEHVRELVQAGALPAAKLEQAEKKLAEAQDEEVLTRALVLTTEELTPPQAADMIAAAQRITDSRKAALDHAKTLMESGAMPLMAYGDYVVSYDRARRALENAQARSRALAELEAMTRVETAAIEETGAGSYDVSPVAERYFGSGVFHESDLKMIMQAYQLEFARPLPISARGETALHRSLGFDHRGRVDVAVDPDQREGLFLRRLLESLHIPYYAFRRAVPGVATGAHIHIGPPSERLRHGG
jgi:hypothetical protein